MKNYINIEGKDIELTEEQIKLIKESIVKPVKELPKTWKELGEITGYYANSCSVPRPEKNITNSEAHKNIFATKEQAEASIALAQLSQLKAVYNDGWVADWDNGNIVKHVICFCDNVLIASTAWSTSTFLSFKDKETRDLFLENFRELIMKAKPLMS